MESAHRPEIRDILARTDLASLLDELATPATHNTRGRRWHCPIDGHDDHHASVTMYTDTRGHQRWRCWSGGDDHRGDALDLVVAVHRLSRRDAIDWLATRIGHLPDPPHPRPQAPPRNPPAPPERLDPAVVTYTTRCAQLLWTPQGDPVRRWLHQRGFEESVLRTNQVGADPGRRNLPRARGLPTGNGHAATFPALDPAGTVCYVQTRYINPRPGQPKYDNPAARLGGNPRLAWLHPPAPHPCDQLIICEGIPDALTAAQAGYRAVALLGTHAADRHAADRLAQYATRHQLTITAVVDADPAGRAAGERLAGLLAAHHIEFRIVEPPEQLDLNRWAQLDRSWTNAVDRGPTPTQPNKPIRHEPDTAVRPAGSHASPPTPSDVSDHPLSHRAEPGPPHRHDTDRGVRRRHTPTIDL